MFSNVPNDKETISQIDKHTKFMKRNADEEWQEGNKTEKNVHSQQ